VNSKTTGFLTSVNEVTSKKTGIYSESLWKLQILDKLAIIKFSQLNAEQTTVVCDSLYRSAASHTVSL